jgi:hypothetical protein
MVEVAPETHSLAGSRAGSIAISQCTVPHHRKTACELQQFGTHLEGCSVSQKYGEASLCTLGAPGSCLLNLSQAAGKTVVLSQGKCAWLQEKNQPDNKCIYLYPKICWASNMLTTNWAWWRGHQWAVRRQEPGLVVRENNLWQNATGAKRHYMKCPCWLGAGYTT